MIKIISIDVNKNNITNNYLKAIKSAKNIVLRTNNCSLAEYLTNNNISYLTLDNLYENSTNFDDLNNKSAEFIQELSSKGDVLYGVLDTLIDSSVKTIINNNFEVSILPCVCTSSEYIAEITKINSQNGIVVFSATDILSKNFNPNLPQLLLEISSPYLASELKLKLMDFYDDETKIYLLNRTKTKIKLAEIELFELDMQNKYDVYTGIFIPAIEFRQRHKFTVDDLVDIISVLRAPGGCPWDRKQTHQTLRQNLLEESYETIDAINNDDDDNLCEELGDVLLQVVFHSLIAKDRQAFNINDIATRVSQKMIDRHVHVFGELKLDTAEDVLKNWEEIKKKEKGLETISQTMEEISPSITALMRANKVQSKAAKVGFDFPNVEEAYNKVYEEINEVLAEIKSKNNENLEMEIGDLLFSIVNVARILGIDSELSLNKSTKKFIKRFKTMEKLIKNDKKALKHLTLNEMDVYFNRGKELIGSLHDEA